MDVKSLASIKMAQLIESEIKSFVRSSPLNRMPGMRINRYSMNRW